MLEIVQIILFVMFKPLNSSHSELNISVYNLTVVIFVPSRDTTTNKYLMIKDFHNSTKFT